MDKIEKLDKALRRFALTGTKQDRIAIDAILHQEHELTDRGKTNEAVYSLTSTSQR